MGDETLDALKAVVLNTLHQQDPRLSIHDFRMVKGLHSHTNLIFDVALPQDLRGREKEFQTGLNGYLNEGSPMTYYTVITFDPEAFNIPVTE